MFPADHLVPMAHFHRQIQLLKNARSITARLFTRSESAASHCQVGNYGLALRTIVDWLDGMQGQERANVQAFDAKSPSAGFAKAPPRSR